MRKTGKRVLQIIVPLIFSLTTKWVAAQTVPLDIKKAIDIALTNNRSLRADSFEVAITDNKNKEIAGSLSPTTKFKQQHRVQCCHSFAIASRGNGGTAFQDYVPVKFGTRYNMRTAVEATQTIYRKDLLLQMRSAGLQTSISKTKYNLSREELVYQVAATFYALQTNAELIRTTTGDYLNMKDILRIAKAQYENAMLKRIDYEFIRD
jgi:outer membrane protein TolC